MEFSESKIANACRPNSSSGACFKRKSPICTFLKFLSLESLDTKGICQTDTENGNGCTLSTILHPPLPLLHGDAGLDVSVNQHLQESVLLLN